ncbi:MAG: hypothetical protein WB775_11115, partial [Burkholderiaceae bacterium]
LCDAPNLLSFALVLGAVGNGGMKGNGKNGFLIFNLHSGSFQSGVSWVFLTPGATTSKRAGFASCRLAATRRVVQHEMLPSPGIRDLVLTAGIPMASPGIAVLRFEAALGGVAPAGGAGAGCFSY